MTTTATTEGFRCEPADCPTDPAAIVCAEGCTVSDLSLCERCLAWCCEHASDDMACAHGTGRVCLPCSDGGCAHT